VDLNEGLNEFTFLIVDGSERKEEKIAIVRDTVPPIIELFDTGTLVEVKEVLLKGSISEIGSTVTVNGKVAEVIANEWQILAQVNPGKNNIKVIAIDKVGNENVIEKEIYVFKKISVEVQIGNKIVYLNGVPQPELPVSPYMKNGRAMVPLRVISECFGAEIKWMPETKEITIVYGDKTILMKIGSTMASVNGNSVTLDVPAEINSGVTFVPIRFISDVFGFEVEWIQSILTARITKLI